MIQSQPCKGVCDLYDIATSCATSCAMQWRWIVSIMQSSQMYRVFVYDNNAMGGYLYAMNHGFVKISRYPECCGVSFSHDQFVKQPEQA